MFTEIYKFEIAQILNLQNSLYNYETFLEFISKFAHPKFFLIYVIPFLAAIHPNLYFDVVFAAVATEYINIIMKWIINEDRPFWWVQESKAYAINRPQLYQTKMTCETTSGFPSGHSMFAATVFYIICIHLIQILSEKYTNKIKLLQIVTWTTYFIILASMTLSRMYFACHFFHQCIGGIVCGVFVAVVTLHPTLKKKVKLMTMKKAIACSILLTLLVFAFYWFQKAFGIDPAWSIRMAFKWCQNPTFLSPDSTPIFCFSRDIFLCFAISFAAPLSKRLDTNLNWMLSFPMVIFIVCMHGLFLHLTPKYNGYIIFYGYSGILYLLSTFSYLVLVPKLCKLKIKSN